MRFHTFSPISQKNAEKRSNLKNVNTSKILHKTKSPKSPKITPRFTKLFSRNILLISENNLLKWDFILISKNCLCGSHKMGFLGN